MDDFDDFYRAEFGHVLRTVALAIGDRDRAEEVTQEGFPRALRRWSSVGGMDSPGGWVVVVAINADRKRWKREADVPVAIKDDGSVDDHAGAVTTSVVLRAALARLTKRQRAAIVLRYFADFPVADIAQALGCAEGTVRATLHQALGIMRVDVGGGVDE